MTIKKRIDILMMEKGLVPSRQRAKALIMAGKVLADTQRIDKPGTLIAENASIFIKGNDLPYVSRGGLKLHGALSALDLNVAGFVCLDVGASTGGFTDCLLQQGASKVYAVDVGYGQLAWQLRQDPRVISIERTNIRTMPADRIPEPVDLITIDASFISLKLIIPGVCQFLKPKGQILALIKPQFEVGKGKVGKGGVVKDKILHVEVIENLKRFFQTENLKCGEVVPSAILGPKGNQEYVIHLIRLSNSANGY